MAKEIGDVWELESYDERRAWSDLEGIMACAIAGQQWAIDYLVRLWDGEEWQSIKDKLNVEGSAWNVLWMDGVRNHLAQSRKRVGGELTTPPG